MNSCRVVLIVLRERLWRFCVKTRTAVFASTSLTITLLVGWALIGALHTTPGTGPGDDGRYLVRGPGYTVLLDTDGPVVMLREPQPAARFGTLGTLARRRTLRLLPAAVQAFMRPRPLLRWGIAALAVAICAVCAVSVAAHRSRATRPASGRAGRDAGAAPGVQARQPRASTGHTASTVPRSRPPRTTT